MGPQADAIFADKNGNTASIIYNEPTHFTISGRPAIHYTATATNIPPDHECDPPSATFDVLTTPGYATAEVLVFVIESYQGLPSALDRSTVDQVISIIRPTERQATTHNYFDLKPIEFVRTHQGVMCERGKCGRQQL
ncbi:hypothetical protein B2J88_16750 [Rhodococcus sp. SRB_17]|nr:hypothetical protein [Rhodococcus sp. SRB_17]